MRAVIMVFLSGILASGCVSTTLTAKTATDKPLSKYGTVVIIPFNANNAIVEEDKYASLPKTIAARATEHLKENLLEKKSFNKITIADSCTGRAIKVESKIHSLIHHKGKFEVTVKGIIADCSTGESLYEFEVEEKDSDSARLPGNAASKLADGILQKLNLKEYGAK